MAAKKTYLEKQEEAADEAQALATEPTEDDVVAQAQAARASWHEGRGTAPNVAWDELTEAKRNRWLEEVSA